MRKGFLIRLAVQNIRKNRKVYYPYMLTAVVTVAMLYIISSLSRNPGLRAESDTLGFTLGLGVWVTTLFSVIFLFYTNSFLMKRRKKEFGLYNILGMEKKHIGRVVGWETVIILAFSLVAGFGSGILMDKLMFLALVRMLGSVGSMSFFVSDYALLFTGSVIGGTFLLIYLNSLRQIHLARPIELLRGGRVGEREPKAKWVLAVLGVLTLGAGYWISISVTNPVAAIFLFFVAVVLVVVGTYLLFTAGSVSLLKLMRRNKGYYYRADHFINVSSMIYRMKQNAVGLANICVLSTMVLVMIFSTVALRMGVEDMAMDRCPNELTFELRDYERGGELEALCRRKAEEAGLELGEVRGYRYLSFAAYKRGDFYDTTPDESDINFMGNDICDLFIVPLEDYNARFGRQETLEPGEILLGDHSGFMTDSQHTGDTLSVLDNTFRIKGRFSDDFDNGLVISSIYQTFTLVVPDMDALAKLDEQQRAVYGKNAGSIKAYRGFDASGDDADAGALFTAIRDEAREQHQLAAAECRTYMRQGFMELYGGLFFIGLFLGLLFVMAMILIVYYKQISEGYDDQERYRIMRKVGLSRAEIKRAIGSQIRTVFFLPLAASGIHVAFSFPAISRMFRALGMFNVTLEALCAAAAFVLFTLLYGAVYALTARVYYKIVSVD